jgi:hypothetical protein
VKIADAHEADVGSQSADSIKFNFIRQRHLSADFAAKAGCSGLGA